MQWVVDEYLYLIGLNEIFSNNKELMESEENGYLVVQEKAPYKNTRESFENAYKYILAWRNVTIPMYDDEYQDCGYEMTDRSIDENCYVQLKLFFKKEESHG